MLRKQIYSIAYFFDRGNIDVCISLRNMMGKNIDGQHLRPPVLAMLLETIERENFDGLLA